MKKADYEYDLSKSIIGRIKNINESNVRTPKFSSKTTLIKEEKDKEEERDAEKKDRKDKNPIAITDEPKFGQNALQNQIDSFKQTVHPGAKFGKAVKEGENPENNPLVYFPNTGNLVFSGTIPSMSGLKFQFSLNDVTSAPYIFVDGLALTDEVVTTLKKLNGFYTNWKNEWLTAGDMLDKLNQVKED